MPLVFCSFGTYHRLQGGHQLVLLHRFADFTSICLLKATFETFSGISGLYYVITLVKKLN